MRLQNVWQAVSNASICSGGRAKTHMGRFFFRVPDRSGCFLSLQIRFSFRDDIEALGTKNFILPCDLRRFALFECLMVCFRTGNTSRLTSPGAPEKNNNGRRPWQTPQLRFRD
jgi:hypothetical protein